MARRLDLLKSVFLRAAEASKTRLGKVRAIEDLRAMWRELRDRRVRIDAASLGASAANAPDVEAMTVRVGLGRIMVDATFHGAGDLAFSVKPITPRFAPRGAKEIGFEVIPVELAKKAAVRDVVAHLSGAIARGLWSPVFRGEPTAEAALVERDGDRLRVDLRSVPTVGRALESSPMAPILDVLSIESFDLRDGFLTFRIGLPVMLPT